jgi:hypothetical protein
LKLELLPALICKPCVFYKAWDEIASQTSAEEYALGNVTSITWKHK